MRDQFFALRIADHDCFARGTKEKDTADAAFCEVDCVRGLCGKVEGRGDGVVDRGGGRDEEGGDGNVDASWRNSCAHGGRRRRSYLMIGTVFWSIE